MLLPQCSVCNTAAPSEPLPGAHTQERLQPQKNNFFMANGQDTRPGHCPRQQLIGQRPSMINQAREVFCQARFPASLIYALIVSPSPAVPSTLCRLPLVILQQAAQSFSAPHRSRVPSCLRLQRKQDAIAFALMVALLVIMYGILLQGSPQRSLSQ